MADVICPSCNERIHQTTEHYRPDLPPNGKMFRLKDFYRENGWSSFIEDESSIGENLCCPDCQGPYPEGVEGRVRVDKDQYIGELLERADVAEKARDFHINNLDRHIEKFREELGGNEDAKPALVEMVSEYEKYEPELPGKPDKQVSGSEVVNLQETGKKAASENTDKIPCPHCGKLYHPKGMAAHIRAKHPEA